MWDQIIYPYQNFDDVTFEVWTWISNFIPHCCEAIHARVKIKLRNIMKSQKSLFYGYFKLGHCCKDIPKNTTNAQGPVSI